MTYAVIASLLLGTAMTLGDFAWAVLHIRHRVVYGLVHGAMMCLCLGLAVGIRAGNPRLGGLAGPVIGVIAAGTFYLLSPALRWNAMFPAWMLLWILFGVLQHRLRPSEPMTRAIVRGAVAAIFSGIAFYLVSGIWTQDSHESPNLPWHFAGWSLAFLPGFIALFWKNPGARAT
jgi:hypothetical protein